MVNAKSWRQGGTALSGTRTNAGDLRTKIFIEDVVKTPDSEGYYRETWTNVFGTGAVAWCQWKNAHGTEELINKQMGLGEIATLRLRYSPKIMPTCRLRKIAEPNLWWEVISVDNIGERGVWLEIKVKRGVAAK